VELKVKNNYNNEIILNFQSTMEAYARQDLLSDINYRVRLLDLLQRSLYTPTATVNENSIKAMVII